MIGGGDGEAFAAEAEILREVFNVGAIGVERVLAGALFGRQHVEKQSKACGVGRLGLSLSPRT